MLWFLLHTALAEPVRVAPANGDIRLDGVLSEAAWSEAPTIGEMARYRPSPGEAPPFFLPPARIARRGVTGALRPSGVR